MTPELRQALTSAIMHIEVLKEELTEVLALLKVEEQKK